MTEATTPTGGLTRHVGNRVHRVGDRRLLTGEGTFVGEASPAPCRP